MDELWFENASLDLLDPYIEGFVLEPHIGYQPIPFREPVRVRYRAFTSRPELRRRPGSFVAIYVNVYADFVKIGSSSIDFVASRMYTQAPIVGTVSAIIVIKRVGTNVENIESMLVEKIARKLRIDREVTRKRSLKHLETYINKLLSISSINGLDSRSLVALAKNIGEECWLTLKDLDGFNGGFEVVNPPNTFVFTSRLDSEDLKVLKTLINESRTVVYGVRDLHIKPRISIGELVILRNGLCILKDGERLFIDFCDKMSLNIRFEMVD